MSDFMHNVWKYRSTDKQHKERGVTNNTAYITDE